MSQQVRDRLQVIVQLSEKKLVACEAAQILGLTVRQVRRLLRRYRNEGDAGLIHRLSGRRSNRATEEKVRAHAMELVAGCYRDYGPTLASEVLTSDHGLSVSRETLRKWMLDEGALEGAQAAGNPSPVARTQGVRGRTGADGYLGS